MMRALALLLIFLALPGAADVVVRGPCEMEWTPATGPVAAYALSDTTGAALGIVAGTRSAVPCASWAAPRGVIAQALDAQGNLGPASLPSEPLMGARGDYQPECNGDGIYTARDAACLIPLIGGARLFP